MRPTWIAASLLSAQSLLAQTKPVTFYYQNVPLWSEESDLSRGGFSDFNRFRVMTDPVFGNFSFQLAYEQIATFRQSDTQGVFVGQVPGGVSDRSQPLSRRPEAPAERSSSAGESGQSGWKSVMAIPQ